MHKGGLIAVTPGMYQFYHQRNATIRSIAPKLRILKNLVVMSVGLAIVQGCFVALRTFLCVSEEVLLAGPLSLAALYAVGAISGLYGAIVARRTTYKVTMMISSLPFIPFIGAVAYARTFTIYPATLLLGLVQGPLWNAAIAYLINLSAQFAYFSFKTQEKLVGRFLTVFNTVLSCGFLFGHLLAAIGFSTEELSYNRTDVEITHRNSRCGCWYCADSTEQFVPITFQSNFSLPTLQDMSNVIPIYHLGVFAGLVALAPLLTFFLLDKLTVQLCSQTNKLTSPTQLFKAVCNVFKDRRLHYMIPLLIFGGLGESFLACDFVKGYVKCTSSKSTIGFVMVCYGCVSTLFYASLGTVIRHIQRLTVIMAGTLFNIGSLCIMWMWKPVSDDQPILYVIGASWAMCDSIWRTLTQTLIYKCFPESWEAPFSTYFILTSVGSFLGFALCPYTCIEYKIYLLGALLIISLGPYAYLEYKVQQEVDATNDQTEFYL